jgi:hypothetical protein
VSERSRLLSRPAGGNGDVAEALPLRGREGKHVGRAVLFQKPAIQLSQVLVVPYPARERLPAGHITAQQLGKIFERTPPSARPASAKENAA